MLGILNPLFSLKSPLPISQFEERSQYVVLLSSGEKISVSGMNRLVDTRSSPSDPPPTTRTLQFPKRTTAQKFMRVDNISGPDENVVRSILKEIGGNTVLLRP